MITESEFEVKAGEGLVFGVPIPEVLRGPGEEFKVRVDVTLAYVAEPRRTRKARRGYLGVWLDWKSSRRGEQFAQFRDRSLKGDGEREEPSELTFPWTLGNKSERDGATDGVSRRNGTVQKDWAVVQNHELPDIFGLVVRGHKGWARRNPEATARFSLVVSFEALGVEVPVYEQIRQAVEIELQQLAEIEIQAPAEQ